MARRLSKYLPVPWKRNLRKVPDIILAKVDSIGGPIVVSCVKKIGASDIANGTYNHLGGELQDGQPRFPEKVVPDPRMGRYSTRNIDGRVIVRRDLPKEMRTYSLEAPAFGDTSNTHTVYYSRAVYPRDFDPPMGAEITTELIGTEGSDSDIFIVRFAVSVVLDKNSDSFFKDLLQCLNVLQENVGSVDVFSSSATLDDYRKTISVEWEILPPGTEDERIEAIMSGMRLRDSDDVRQIVRERYNVLIALNPKEIVKGTSGFHRYFGAKFHDSLVAFENVRYGNAIYVMFENWEELSQLTRIDLLKRNRRDFARIEHRPGWQNQLKVVVDELMSGVSNSLRFTDADRP